MKANAPIVAAPLFPELSRRFVALLENLSPADWERPVSPSWRVRSVVAHLLDSSLRRLSTQRDGHEARGAGPVDNGYAALVDYLNGLNADWIRATERLSPRLLTELIRWSDAQLAALFASLDPLGTAQWPVAWAGEAESRHWFDIAREYTEKWHHAQQVFDATGRPSTIGERELMHPCLDALMRALPHGLRNCTAPDGSTVRVVIAGSAGGTWIAAREEGRWRLAEAPPARVVAEVRVDQDEACKLFMKRLSAAEALARFPSIRISGDPALGGAVLEMTCVMA